MAASLVKKSVVYSAGMLFESLCGMVLGLFVARLMGPRIQGIWQTARLFRTYSEFATLGQTLGMRREAAVAEGRGDAEAVAAQRDTGFTWATFSLGLVGVGVALYAWLFPHPLTFRHALTAVAVAVAVSGLITFFNLWYKTIERFGALAVAAVAGGVVSLLSIEFLRRFGFEGMLWGYVLAAVTTCAVLASVHRGPLGIRIDRSAWVASFSVGFPLFLITVGGILFSTLDRIVVVARFGFVNMGFYSVSTMSFMPIWMAVSSASVVLLPRVCRRFGQTGSPEDIARYLVDPLSLLMIGLSGLAGLAAVALPVVVELLLPGYQAGIRPAQIVLFGLPFSCVAGFFENVILASGRTWRMAAASFAASGFKLALVWLVAGWSAGLVGVAAATVGAYVIQFLLLLEVAGRAAHCGRRVRFRLAFEAVLSAVACGMLSFVVRDIRLLLEPAESWLVWGRWAALLLMTAVPALITVRRAYRLMSLNRSGGAEV